MAMTVKASVEVWRARVRFSRLSMRDLSRERWSESSERWVCRAEDDCWA